MISGEPSRTGTPWRSIALGLFVVLVLILSFVAFLIWQFEQANRQSAFAQGAAAAATTLQRSIQEYLEVLYGLSSVFTVSLQPLTRAAFREVTSGPLRRYPGVEALGWVPRVTEAELASYLAAARADGRGEIRITEWTPQMHMAPAARREVYYPLSYIEPFEKHRAAIGFNLGSVPAYLEAMQKALSSGEAAASAWRALGHDTEEQLGFLLFVPLYTRGMPHTTFEARRANLQGFTLAMVRLGTLVDRALQGTPFTNIGLELSDVTDAASKYLLAYRLDASQISSWQFLPRQSAQTAVLRGGVHWETTSQAAGRTWSMLFYPLQDRR